ncbi:unnamed protein product [Trifolium pratense]|uniref:Uncharacterized protein n=1 Tax=Trifolium pratense TaxID=57577 RepID=A0ACB0IKH7_TRIPR|nr:unnamed protein product [Trifolium pratense]
MIGPKKLLIMNLNGFLIRRVYYLDTRAIPEFRKADDKYGAFFLYKREFSEEFMKFCLERFEVGIWSSAQKYNIYGALRCAIGESMYKKLLFVWENTAIFTKSYDPEDSEDRELDPNGELCNYLRGVAEAEDVQSYVMDNPFGEAAITSSHPDWKFYSKVRYYQDGKRIRSFR